MCFAPGFPAAGAIDEIEECGGGETGAVALPVPPRIGVVGQLPAVPEKFDVGVVEGVAHAVAHVVAEIVDERGRLEERKAFRHLVADGGARPLRPDAVVFALQRSIIEPCEEIHAAKELGRLRSLYQFTYALLFHSVFLLDGGGFSAPFRRRPAVVLRRIT